MLNISPITSLVTRADRVRSASKTVALGQAEEITLKGEITFAGLPELTYTMDAEDVEILYNSTKFLTVIETENFALRAGLQTLG